MQKYTDLMLSVSKYKYPHSQLNIKHISNLYGILRWPE